MFTYSSNPNIPIDVTQYINATWPEYDKVNQQYLVFNLTSASVKQHFCARCYAFWTSLIPAIVTDSEKGQPTHLRSPVDVIVGK